jgi:hypothetical protein
VRVSVGHLRVAVSEQVPTNNARKPTAPEARSTNSIMRHTTNKICQHLFLCRNYRDREVGGYPTAAYRDGRQN